MRWGEIIGTPVKSQPFFLAGTTLFMDDFMKKWGLLFRALVIVGVLLVIRAAIVLSGYDLVPMNTLITAFVGAVIFTIAILFTGTLADFKEAEKIPSELVASLHSLHMDTAIVPLPGDPVIPEIQGHIRDLIRVFARNFRANTWDIPSLHGAMDQVNGDIAILAGKNVAPPLLVKMRNELTTLDRISNRVHAIASTSFIPTAYAIAELAIAAVVVVLLFLEIEIFLEGLILIAGIAGMLIGLLLLIRDMDNPFEVGKSSFADVDLQLLWDLEESLGGGTP